MFSPTAFQPQRSFLPPPTGRISRFDDIAARIAAHDVLMNGNMNGTIYYQTLFNPKGSGQGEVFLSDPERASVFMNMLQRDYYDDGVVNGSAQRKVVVDNYYNTTGHYLAPIMNAPLRPADTSYEAIFKPGLSNRDPDFLQKQMQYAGLNATQLGAYALWGHAAGQNGFLTDQNVRPFLANSYSNPQAIDYRMIQSSPEIKRYVENLYWSQSPAQGLNNGFLSAMEKVFNLPGQLVRGPQPRPLTSFS